MKFFQNRKLAIFITVVVVIFATLFGVGRSLARLSKDIEQMFYDGVYLESEGYTQPGIALQLDNHATATLGLATILIDYPELQDSAEEVLRLRRELLDAESISDKSLAFLKMSTAVRILAQASIEANLSARDMEAISQYTSTIDGAETFIGNSAYNQALSLRWNEQSFITRMISFLIPVKMPQPF